MDKNYHKRANLNVFALYQGDDFLFMGTGNECAEWAGFSSYKTIEQYATKSVRGRKEATGALYAIRVDDIDEELA